MQNARVSKLSEIDYLTGERVSTLRHEYIAGEVFAMAGGSKAHNTIALNLALLLRTGLRGHGCQVFMADMRVRIAAQASYYYPDVVATCAASDLAPDAPPESLDAPCLIIEVLSRSTEAIDRREKWLAYQQIASLAEYVLVDQEQRRVEVLRRAGTDWQRTIADASGDVLTLMHPSHPCQFSLADIYEGSGVA
jgi:Uma2 family endonuclease